MKRQIASALSFAPARRQLAGASAVSLGAVSWHHRRLIDRATILKPGRGCNPVSPKEFARTVATVHRGSKDKPTTRRRS